MQRMRVGAMAAERRAGARAYQEIKKAILSGELKQRQHLEIDELASRWRVSATPVRNALAVLTAERLVALQPARGYSVAFWSEAELGALYEWRWQLARLASEAAIAPTSEPPVSLDRVEEVLALFALHAESSNAELKRAALAADERLIAAYRVEHEALPQTERELVLLREAFIAADTKKTAQRLRVFFRRRILGVAAVRARAAVRALPRNGD
jgi:DNA-binding GntR family transcriptional regulator